jgi:type VI protein secretion system component VasA
MVGISDDEALMPRTRPTFEGYRLLREYFIMPERFHYARVHGTAAQVVRKCEAGLEIIFLFRPSGARTRRPDAGRFRAFRDADHQSVRA